MSEPVDIPSYPSFNIQHLEILPALSAKLQYFEIPTSAPMMSSEEKAAFLDILIKCVVPHVSDTETGFQVTYLQNEDCAQAIRRLNSGFQWVKSNQ